ncbi:hypothetical protein RB653_007416 [Dictyostelium firmibasis]|uniref:Zinc-binding loop region of homing endonuclease domain-containing protein n=1 Tax=Dictyostelium firmibasis TaxID=79012 RepID=A0AAN7YXK1_9MYCE
MEETNINNKQQRKKIEKLVFPIQFINDVRNFLNNIDYDIGEVNFISENHNQPPSQPQIKAQPQPQSPQSQQFQKEKNENNKNFIDKNNIKFTNKQTSNIYVDETCENQSNSSIDEEYSRDETFLTDSDSSDDEPFKKLDIGIQSLSTTSPSSSSSSSPHPISRKRVHIPSSPYLSPLHQSSQLKVSSQCNKKVRFSTPSSSKIRKNDIFDLNEEEIKSTYKMLMEVVDKKSKKECWLLNREEMNLNQKKIFKNDGVNVEVRVCGNVLLGYVKGHSLVWYNNTNQDKKLYVYPKPANSHDDEQSNVDSDGNGHGFIISFLCNNRKCLNPNHLYCENRLIKRDICHSTKNNEKCIHFPKCLIKRNDGQSLTSNIGKDNEKEQSNYPNDNGN